MIKTLTTSHRLPPGGLIDFSLNFTHLIPRRIETRKLNWKAETKLDTKNMNYLKMMGQSMDEGLDKKTKVAS